MEHITDTCIKYEWISEIVCWEEARYKRARMTHVHLFEILEQAKLTHDEAGIDWEGSKDTFRCGKNILYLHRDLDYTDMCICQNLVNVHLKSVYFNVH